VRRTAGSGAPRDCAGLAYAPSASSRDRSPLASRGRTARAPVRQERGLLLSRARRAIIVLFISCLLCHIVRNVQTVASDLGGGTHLVERTQRVAAASSLGNGPGRQHQPSGDPPGCPSPATRARCRRAPRTQGRSDRHSPTSGRRRHRWITVWSRSEAAIWGGSTAAHVAQDRHPRPSHTGRRCERDPRCATWNYPRR